MPMNRRKFLKASAYVTAGVAASTSAPFSIRRVSAAGGSSMDQIKKMLEKHRGETLTIASWGGSFQEAQRKAYFEPFSKEFGITVAEDSPPNNPKIISMVESGNVTWDVVDTGAFKVIPLDKEGVLEELDYDLIDTNGVIDEFIMKAGVGNLSYSELLSYRTDVLPDGPTNVTDIWDLEAYSGKRGLRDNPISNIPFALMADGVAKEDVYPLDQSKFDRAYRKLDELKQNAIWWEQNAQSPVWIANQQVQMATAMNGRLDKYIEEGVPLELVWEGAQLMGDAWVIPKGTPKSELAHLFIAWATQPEVNWRLSKFISYGPVNRKSADLVPEKVRHLMPTSHVDKQLVCDFENWGEHYSEQVDRWREWSLA